MKGVAELPPGGVAGIFCSHPVLPVFFGLQFEVEPQLFFEVAFEACAVKENVQSPAELANPPRPGISRPRSSSSSGPPGPKFPMTAREPKSLRPWFTPRLRA
jgi:hypothetical protein